MKTINVFKNEVLGALAFLFGLVATLIVSGNGYYNMSKEGAWLLFAYKSSCCFTVTIVMTFVAYYTAEFFNKYATQRMLLNLIKKYNAICEKLLED